MQDETLGWKASFRKRADSDLEVAKGVRRPVQTWGLPAHRELYLSDGAKLSKATRDTEAEKNLVWGLGC